MPVYVIDAMVLVLALVSMGQGVDNFLSLQRLLPTPAKLVAPVWNLHNHSSAWHITTFSPEIYLDSLITGMCQGFYFFLSESMALNALSGCQIHVLLQAEWAA